MSPAESECFTRILPEGRTTPKPSFQSFDGNLVNTSRYKSGVSRAFRSSTFLYVETVMHVSHRLAVMVVLSLLTLFCSLPVLSQSEAAAVSGRVADPQGLAVVGAKVSAVNTSTNVASSTQTNGAGFYNLPSLLPGTYRIIVEKEGFAQIVKPDVQLHVQDNAGINFSLQVGSVTQSVTVEGGAPLVNTESAAVSTVVDRKYVENMPLNGRSFQDLILLTPGVLTTTPQNTAVTGRSGEFSVNGQRAESNYYTVDGVSANVGIAPDTAARTGVTGSLPGPTALGTTQSVVPLDALEEFRVATSSYSAEYGRNPGGQFSFLTRSGNNVWHGTAFDYLRNDVFDANNWFNTYFGAPKPPLRQNDFGGTLGGPVQVPHLYDGRDKTFFFFSYEGLRLIQPQAATKALVPDSSLRQNTPAPLQTVLNGFPVPTGADLGNGLAEFVGSWSNPGNIDSTSVRLDHIVNEKLRIFFRFANTTSGVDTRDLAIASLQNSTAQTTRTYTMGATSSFSNSVANDFRLNYSSNEIVQSETPGSFGGATPVNLFQLQGLTAGGSATPLVAVIFILPAQSSLFAQYGQSGKQRQWNVVDTVMVSRGRHQFKLGLDFRRLEPEVRAATPNVDYYYFSVASVQANSVDLGFGTSTAAAFPVYTNFSTFVDDAWKITPRLSLSIGLRWEINPAPGAANGNLPYTVVGNSLATLALAPQGTPLWKTSWYNFAPRLGAVYLLRNTPNYETALRGGGGVFFDTGQQTGSDGYRGPGFSANSPFFGNFFGVPAAFPVSAAQVTPAIVNPPVPPYTASQVYAYPTHLQLPYTLQWNASIQQALGKSQALTLSYVGAVGRRLLELNQVIATPFNPNFGQINFTRNGLTSDYGALQIQYQRRLAHGLQVLGSYTWGHAIDYGSTNYSLPYNRGNSDFDVRHSLSSAISYDLPSTFQSRFGRTFLHHWGLDSRITARTAFPVTLFGNEVTDPATGQQFFAGLDLVSGQPLYVSGSQCAALYNNGKGCPGGRAINPNAFSVPTGTNAGDAPRNFVRGFGAWQMDLAMRRDFPIYERLKLQFRAEAFNVFNHPNFGTVNPYYCSPDPGSPNFAPGCTFGQAQGTLADGLGGLNALYQMGGPRSMQLSLRLVF